MKLFGVEISRGTYTPSPPEKSLPERSSEADNILERLNQFETRLERVEFDNSERQIAVLSSVEKVLHQLRARTRKRERDAEAEAVEASNNGDLSGPFSSAHLAARFRR